MGIRERSAERKKRMQSHRAANFEDADRWDLKFWQSCSPEERLSALVSIRQDIEKVTASRKTGGR